MLMKTDSKEMVAYDFSNINYQESGSSNCFASPCDEPVCDCDCDSDHCDECDCDVCDSGGCDTCDYYEE